MKLRRLDKTNARLTSRQADYDKMKDVGKGRTRPGSRNPKKGTAAPAKRR